MPTFKVVGQHMVSTQYEVEANSLEEAIEIVKDDGAEPSGPETYIDDSFEVNDRVTAGSNTIQYAVVGHFGGSQRQGILFHSWKRALESYLIEFPIRNPFLEVFELTMAVNGAAAEPVWEEKFFEHVSDIEIPVRSIRDPRDPSDQAVRGGTP